ncbi:hypothetical protein CKO44_07815 [Rubrivivax gelatinosus]|uniref:phage baseplate assembly protein n=1 Tax=Rubrivivax gelatinosus TaxID=28068 RepID=UPI0019059386|nr:contractile injection system protein, VgrG/Pvc8 family [Rubrivivax gelatinosus]MBK1613375.1 hypothetical protein [Rubrivivax gelatinosus]
MPATYTRDQARITVTVNGQAYDGWLQSEVERGLESIAGTFSVPVSLTPGAPPAIVRGDEVSVSIGSAVVITGYVLSAEPFYRRGDCGMRIVGRDRTGDLVHCSAIHRGGQWLNAGLDRVVRDLVEPFGIKVLVDADLGAKIPDFKIQHGETVLDALSRAARLRGVLVTRDDHGRLLLTRAGKTRFKGAIVRGQNVIEMQGIGTDEARHSAYIAYGQAAVVDDFELARTAEARATDPEIKRYLPLVVNAEGHVTRADLKALVDHMARVRRGHSYGIRYVVEGWTFEGDPWPPNARVAVYDDVAGLDGAEWLITHVKHTCDRREGDVTELVVRPIEAYDTAPLKTKVGRKRWAKRGPTDKALGGE